MEEDTQKRTDRDLQTFALPKEAIAVCTRYVDELLAKQVLLGCKQIVCLGPSLSDRIMKKHRVEKHIEEVTYFKIARTRQDGTLQFIPGHPDGKRNTAKAKFIPGDYVKDDLISLLSANGFDFDMPTWFLWEVEVLHLRRGEVIFVLERIRDSVKNFQISLNYLSCKSVAMTSDRTLNEPEKLDKTKLLAFKDFETFVKGLGLKVIENLSVADLYAQYYSISSPSHLFESYFVCTLGSSRL